MGVGNIVAAVVLAASNIKRTASQNGTIGMQAPRLTLFNYEWVEDSFFLMHSDGLVSHWKLEDYLGLAGKHSSVIAGVFYRDFRRGTDDVTVLVIKEKRF